jgi:hypothetical protein
MPYKMCLINVYSCSNFDELCAVYYPYRDMKCKRSSGIRQVTLRWYLTLLVHHKADLKIVSNCRYAELRNILQ